MMEGFNVKIKLKTLTCHNQPQKSIKTIPYLWTIFFRIDGACVEIAHNFKLIGKGVFHYGKGSHGNLNISNITKKETVFIPQEVGEWTTSMTPFRIPYFEQKVPSIIGAICVLMEQKNVSGKGAEAGHTALNQQIERAVNESLAAFDPKNIDINDVMGSIKNYFENKVATYTDTIQNEIIEAIKSNQSLLRNLWTLMSADNMIGQHVWNFNQKDILGSQYQTLDFNHRWRTTELGDWEIQGNISIVDENIPQKAPLQEYEAKSIKPIDGFTKKLKSAADSDAPLEMINLAL
jgi:hypothetical protein